MQAALLKLEQDAEQEPGQQSPGGHGAAEAPAAAAAAAPAQRSKPKLLEDDSLDAVLDGSGGAGPSQPEETQRDRLVRLVRACQCVVQQFRPLLFGRWAAGGAYSSHGILKRKKWIKIWQALCQVLLQSMHEAADSHCGSECPHADAQFGNLMAACGCLAEIQGLMSGTDYLRLPFGIHAASQALQQALNVATPTGHCTIQHRLGDLLKCLNRLQRWSLGR